MMTTYTYDPMHLNKSERRVARLQGAVSKSGELMPLDELLTIAGPIREVVPDHYQYAERKMVQILQEAEANCLAMIAAHKDAVNAMVDRLIENETLSLAEFEEILAAHPPKGEFPTIGPDTPAKSFPTEATEDLIGMRSIADPREKIKAAAKYYNLDITKDEPKLRNAENFKPATSLGEYLRPFSEKSIQKWQYEVSPRGTWNHLATQEADKEDPQWRVRETIRVCREADDDRTIELRGILSSIEAQRDAGGELSEFDKRRVEACEAEIARIAAKWSGEGWKPTAHDLNYSLMFDDPDMAKSEYHFWADMPRYTQETLYNMGRRIDRMAKNGSQDPQN